MFDDELSFGLLSLSLLEQKKSDIPRLKRLKDISLLVDKVRESLQCIINIFNQVNVALQQAENT